jgi:ribosomal protein S16
MVELSAGMKISRIFASTRKHARRRRLDVLGHYPPARARAGNGVEIDVEVLG